jgi:hypothetical protein
MPKNLEQTLSSNANKGAVGYLIAYWVNAVGNSNYPKNEEGTKVVGNKETEPVILDNPVKIIATTFAAKWASRKRQLI